MGRGKANTGTSYSAIKTPNIKIVSEEKEGNINLQFMEGERKVLSNAEMALQEFFSGLLLRRAREVSHFRKL